MAGVGNLILNVLTNMKEYALDFFAIHNVPLSLVVYAFSIAVILAAARISVSYINDNAISIGNTEMGMFDKVLSGLNDGTVDDYFRGAGLNMNFAKYNSIRFIILATILLFFVLSSIQMKSLQTTLLLLWIVVYVLSYPNEVKRIKTTPFKYIMRSLNQRRFMKRDEELAALIVQLKNLIAAQKNVSWNGDYTIETLMKFSDVTKPIFSQMLIYYRNGYKTRAFEYLDKASGTRVGRDFAAILSKLDEMNPSELNTQLLMLQDGVRDERETRQIKKQELLENLFFMVIMLVCMAIILNFVYIALIRVALDQLGILSITF